LRIAVIGAGIVGVTTAYELAAAGQDVTVYERRGSVASEASFAHAGIVAPTQIAPWVAPGPLFRLLRPDFDRHAPARLPGLGTFRHWPWLWRAWRENRPAAYAAHRAALLRLARFSQDHLNALTASLRLDYEQRSGGLVLLRSERELAQARAGLKQLAEMGATFELLDAERARQREPALNPDQPLRAAIYLPNDGVGNARQFAQLLRTEAQRHGTRFRFDEAVLRVVPGTAPTVVTAGGEQTFDAVVLCSGVESNTLLRPIGLTLPLVPVYGYSLTAPMRHVDGHPELGPRAALRDARYDVTVSRLGQRIRVAGGAEIGGSPTTMNPTALRTLYKVLDDWFPGAARLSQASAWKGARPMLPGGPPVLGASGTAGVWLNLGHGANGWALCCGSARVLAEQIAGRAPPLDLTGLGVARLRG